MNAVVIAPPVDVPVTDPMAELAEWEVLKQRVAQEATPLVELERAKRKRLFAHFFPTPKEGTNKYPLSNGWELSGTYPIDRSVDIGALQGLQGATVGASMGLLQLLKYNVPQGTPPETPIVQFMRIQLDQLVKWEPALQVKPYRVLTEEQRTVFDQCLMVKPGSLSMSIVLPKKRGA